MDKYRIGPDDDNDSDDGLNFDFGDSGLGNFDDIEEAYGANNPGDPATAGRSPPTGRNYRSNLSAKGSANFAEALRRKRGPETMSVKKAFADRDLVDLNENLGDDFYKSVWEPPTVALAEQYLANTVYQGGEADLRNASIIEDTQLGMGVSLYFQIAYSLSIALIVMSFLSIPVMLFAFSAGDGVPLRDRDIVGFYRLTLGNIGHDRDSYDYEAEARCSEDGSDKDDICLDVFGQAVSIQQVAMLVTIFEMFQVGIFVITIFHLQRRLHQLQERHRSLGVPSITDYAVYVKNIPPDTTTKELVQHFSKLYQLEEVDFMSRKPVEHTAPVDSADYSKKEVVIGSWVADCIVLSKVRKIIFLLCKRKKLMKQLYDARARTQIYMELSQRTMRFKKRLKEAEYRLLFLGSKVDDLNQRLKKAKETVAVELAERHLRQEQAERDVMESVKADMEEEEKENQRLESLAERWFTAFNGKSYKIKGRSKSTKSSKNDVDTKSQRSQDSFPVTASQKEKKLREMRPAMAGFVSFEYNESMARCLDDEDHYSLFPFNLFYPDAMKFKGHRLHITRAPEPDQLLWENLEVSSLRKGCMRLLTAFLSIVFLLILYALLAAAASYRTEYVKEMPSDGLCPRALPFLYTGGYPVDDSEDFVADFQWSRAPMEHREDLDKQCDKVSGSYYAYYALDGDFSDPVATFDIAACDEEFNSAVNASDVGGLCPSITQTVFCPCLNPDATEKCKSLGCYGNKDDETIFVQENAQIGTKGDDDAGFNNVGFKDECVEFTAGDIPKCYCQSVVDRVVERNGVVGVMSWGFTAISGGWDEDTTECYDALFGYSASTVGIYVMILVVAVANHLLCDWVAYSTKLELHEMLDELHLAVAVKAFLLSFCSMSILILVAFGSSTKSPSYIDGSYIFDGPYSDFSRGWYGSVGFFLVSTFFLTAFAPICADNYHFISFKISQWRALDEIRGNKHVQILTQQALNKRFVYRELNVPLRTGKMMSLLFIAMTFAPGTPLLTLFCAFAFMLIVRMDKVNFCRRHVNPVPVGSALSDWVLNTLPWAAALRLIIACFMYTSDEIFPVELMRSSATGGQSMDTDAYRSTVSQLGSDRARSEGTGISAAWFEDRVMQYNTFPLFIFFLVLTCYIFLRSIWKYLPFYWIARLMRSCTRRCMMRFPHLDSLFKVHTFKASKGVNFIHPYDLTFGTSDPIRNQEAPLTGGYSKLLRHKDDKRGHHHYVHYLPALCCYCLEGCTPQHSEKPHGRKWEILDLDLGYEARIRTWPAMVQLIDGSLKFSGDQKYTYDVISERHCNSFRIEELPQYRALGFELITSPITVLADEENVVKDQLNIPTNAEYKEWAEHRAETETALEEKGTEEYAFQDEERRLTKKEKVKLGNELRRANRVMVIDEEVEDDLDEEAKVTTSTLDHTQRSVEEVESKKHDEKTSKTAPSTLKHRPERRGSDSSSSDGSISKTDKKKASQQQLVQLEDVSSEEEEDSDEDADDSSDSDDDDDSDEESDDDDDDEETDDSDEENDESSKFSRSNKSNRRISSRSSRRSNSRRRAPSPKKSTRKK